MRKPASSFFGLVRVLINKWKVRKLKRNLELKKWFIPKLITVTEKYKKTLFFFQKYKS